MMVVRLVARVQMETMTSKVLYPVGEHEEERVALLAGIVQLVQAALEQQDMTMKDSDIHYMKSGTRVVGYFLDRSNVYIVEGEDENESGSVMKMIMRMLGDSEVDVIRALQKALRKRGAEISSLWD